MKRIGLLIGCLYYLFTASAAIDITLVDNQPMQDASSQMGKGWFKYTLTDLSVGDDFNVIFNNGGWENGQSDAYYVEYAQQNMCFTSDGEAVYQVECSGVTTDIEEGEAAVRIYSRDGAIEGYAHGQVEVYNLAYTCVQTIQAEGYFCSASLGRGIYLVKVDNQLFKILVY